MNAQVLIFTQDFLYQSFSKFYLLDCNLNFPCLDYYNTLIFCCFFLFIHVLPWENIFLQDQTKFIDITFTRFVYISKSLLSLSTKHFLTIFNAVWEIRWSCFFSNCCTINSLYTLFYEVDYRQDLVMGLV